MTEGTCLAQLALFVLISLFALFDVGVAQFFVGYSAAVATEYTEFSTGDF